MWSARGLVLLLAFALGCVRAQVNITTQPTSQQNIVPGTTIMFTVVAIGSNLTYQWQRNGEDLSDGARYSGTTTATLTVMNVMEADEGSYTCVVTDGVNNDTSNAAQLTVLADCGSLNNPANGQVSHTAGTTEGQNATYSCNTGYNLMGDNTRTCQATGNWSGSAPTCELVDCSALTNPPNGQISTTGGTTFGQNATYSCNTGYNLMGDNTRTCEATGNWSGSAPTCQIVDCSALIDPANGQVSTTGTTFGQNATYSCNTGYNLMGDSIRTCEATGNWSGSAPTCQIVDCDTLSNPANGQVSTTGATFGENATYSCNTGYNLMGDNTRTCQASGEWSGSAPTCQPVDCGPLTDPANGQVDHTAGTTFGQTAMYSCNTGYNLVGNSTRTCQATGNWSGSEPTCRIVDCSALTDPANGQVSTTATTFGETATYSCNIGYNLMGDNTRTCQATGNWSGSAPTCQIVNCNALNDPANGEVDDSAGTTFGQNATYNCNTGYNLVGNSTRTCQADGMWSGSVPTCQIVDCNTLPDPANGQVSTSGTTFGQNATYSCNTGYNLVGDSTRTCRAAGVWSGSAPTCELERPQITQQPANQTDIDPGSTVTFTVNATTGDTNPLTYLWQRDDTNLVSSSELSGIATDTLTIANVQESNEGMYGCVVTNAAGNTTSNPAQLTVLDPPRITTQPLDRLNVIPGSTVMFTVTASGLRLNYTWLQNGSALPSDSRFVTANEMLTIQNVMPSDAGSYSCVVSNAAGNDTSDPARLTLIGPPDITVPPENVAVENGSNAEFNCTATGLGNLTFTWTTPVGTLPSSVESNDTAAMTATSTLRLTGVDTSYSGDYICTVRNERESDTEQATLSVIVIDDIPDQTVTTGLSVTFNCSAEGSTAITYQWRRTERGSLVERGFEDVDRVSGMTTPTLTILNVGVLDEGEYTCFVSVSDNRVGTRTANLTTQGPNITDLTFTPDPVTEGENLMLECVTQNNLDAPNNLMFYWYHNETRITDEDSRRMITLLSEDNATRVASSILMVTNVTRRDGGLYRCSVFNRNITDKDTATTFVTVYFAPELTFRTEQGVATGRVRRNVTTSLSLSCRVNAVPAATFVEIRRRNATDEIMLNRTDLDDSNIQFVQYTLSNLMLSDSSDVFSCVANNSVGLREVNFTLVVQAPPGQVDNATVRSENLNLRNTRLTWEAPENNNAPITTYWVTSCISFTDSTNDTCIGQTTIAVKDPAVPTISLTDISPQRRYRITIRAKNAAGMGPESQPYFFDSATADDGRPRNLADPFVSGTGVVLSWQLPPLANNQTDADVIVDMYIINYNRVGNEPTMTTSRDPRIAIGGLDLGQMYQFRVSANYSLPVLLSTEGTLNLTTMRFVSTTDAPPVTTATSITVSWMAPPGAEFLVNYIVQFSTASSRRRRQIPNRVRVDPSQTSYTLTGSENGIQPFENYTLQVLADFGNDLVTSIVDPFTVLTEEGAPDPPQNLQVVDAFHDYLGLRWEPPTRPNGIITGYNVYYTRDGRRENRIVRDYEEGSIYQLSGLRYGSMFRIQVAARTSAGEGQMSLATIGNTTIGVFPPRIVGSPDGANYRLDINQFQLDYGPLSHYKIVVVLNGAMNMNTKTAVPDGMLRPYNSNDNQMTFYAAASINVVDYQRTFTIGDNQSYTQGGVVFMNSPLRADQQYVFFVRLYSSQTNGGFNDSRVTAVFTPQPPVNTAQPAVDPVVIIAPIAAVALLLLIIFLILIFIAIFTRKSSGVKRHRLDDGLVDGKKKKAHAVELRRTRLFSPVLNVATPDVFTSAGQPTTLICEASGTPAPDVSWTCNDKPVDKERFIQLADSSLFIQDTDLQDEGSYLVVATNSAGTTEQMVRVTVVRPVPPEPDVMHKPIPVGDFTERIALLRANDDEGLEDEYADLDLDWNFTSYAAKLNINKNKNRYVNIIPYDHARVVLTLQDNTPGSDYINASYIDGYNQPNAYVATQGPIPSTFPDFWRMVWELDCPTIVMVTNLKEDDKVKCNQYWPSYGTTTYGSLQVTLKEVENLAEYSIRTFNVSPLAGQSKVQMPVREVRQFHFLVWPDHGVPQYATALLSFRKRVVRYHSEKRGPMVVHCSAGVGRTGTFITIDAMLKQLEAENIVDIFNFARHMRFRRNYMVQTSPQYVFLHDALLEAIMCGDTSIPAPELRTKLQSLVEVDPDTNKTRIDTQFETLVTASPPDEDFDTTIAELPDNKPKNRFNRHLPSNALRVTLSTDNDQSDYICASFIDGYRQRVAFIVTQAPMENTIGDFWRMIWEQKSAAIVMLTELEEGGKEMCVKYWPVEVGQPEVFGAYQVELSDDEREVGDYITRKFKLSPIDKPQESRIITQLHYIHWPRSSAPSNTRSIIDLIDQLQRVQRKSGNGPITVHCDDGLGRTGAFCTLYTVLERVKAEQVVDVFQAVKTIRIQRAGMLESLPQYEFVHKAVLEFLDSFSDYQNFK